MSFGGLILTNIGRNKMAAAISEKTPLQFTHIQLGDGNYNGSYSSKTKLSHLVMEIPVTHIQRKDDQVLIECDWNSTQAPVGFYLREIGIIGNGGLCYYDNAREGDAEFIDPESGVLIKQKRFQIVLKISNDVSVQVSITSGLYALKEELDADVQELRGDLNEKADKDHVPYKTGEGASGTWGIDITGNAGTSTKLAAPRTIFGRTFDGSENVTGKGQFFGATGGSGNNAVDFNKAAIEIREAHLAGAGEGYKSQAPTISFHWANRVAAAIALFPDGSFNFKKQDGISKAIIVADLSGNAASATKLSTSAGSATTPVYFSDGKPVACSYTLGKSVPSNAVFTDTTYGTATESTNGLLSASDKKKLGLIYSASCTKGASTRSTLLGTGNRDSGDENIIAAGYGNTIGNATQSAIIAGSANIIPTPTSGSTYYRNSTVVNGHGNYVSGSNVLIAGNNNQAHSNQTAFGHFCKLSTIQSSESGSESRTAFMIGNGSSDSSRSNAFRVNYNGTVYATNSTIATGADYAEYFEWADGNPDGEDRVGLFVTFDEQEPEKIKIASPGDYILGIVSGHPNTIGNGDEDWRGRYVLDDFGRYIEETYEYEEIWQDKDGAKHVETREGIRYKENPDYDPEEQYIPREERPEWSAIGMVGVLSVYDDGTCQVNGYCRCGEGGIATLVEERTFDTYRVIQRISDNIIKVVIKP